jgi:hypothetical protein
MDENRCDWWNILNTDTAFDIVDHNILLPKIKYYVIQGNTGSWFKLNHILMTENRMYK